MTKPWPFPPPQPLERLQVSDGLLMNAQRWRLAHRYHQNRQNLQYQLLSQPGIVFGLGVRAIAPPETVKAEYRDRRWLEIQAGIAIDLFGNLIVVPTPVSFRLASENRTAAPLAIYLVVRYVDPEELSRRLSGDLVKETFRLDEKSSPPELSEIELCRILLPPAGENPPATAELSVAADVFHPSYHHLNLLHRPQARSRPQMLVSIGQLILADESGTSQRDFRNLTYLLQSLSALTPQMSGVDEPVPIPFNAELPPEQLSYHDLLFFKASPAFSPSEEEVAVLKAYLETGGVLLVEPDLEGTNIPQLIALQREIEIAIVQASSDRELTKSIQELETELEALQSDLKQKIEKISHPLRSLAQELETPLQALEQYSPPHLTQTQPFLFSTLPTLEGQPLQLFVGGGIVVAIGNLSSAWGVERQLPRETIRTAQELGINLLHFAWKRRQLTQLQTTGQTQDRPSLTAAPPGTLTGIFQKLIEPQQSD